MELILLESVTGLGRPGDKVKVKPGYARNFLLPQGKAVRVSADALRHIDKLKQKAQREEREAIASTQELAAKLQGASVDVTALATEEGHLFGSVTEQDIQAALKAAGWQLPDKSVRLETHVKEAGPATAQVHLYGDILTTVQVQVVPVDVHGDRIHASPSAPEAASAGLAEEAPEQPAADPAE